MVWSALNLMLEFSRDEGLGDVAQCGGPRRGTDRPDLRRLSRCFYCTTYTIISLLINIKIL